MVLSGTKRPGMRLVTLCEYLVDELSLLLRGRHVVPSYYGGVEVCVCLVLPEAYMLRVLE